MTTHQGQIPGLYSSEKNVDWSNDSMTQDQSASMTDNSGMDTSQGQNNNLMIHRPGKPLVSDLRREKDSLGLNFVHSHRLLDAEISKLQHGSIDLIGADPDVRQCDKIYVSLKDQKQHNLLGRLLGPKGVTLKRIQAETQTKISILGRGSIRDKKREEELRNSSEPGYEHLKDSLHILIEANPPFSNVKLAAGVAEMKKMLIPLSAGMEDLVVAKFLDPVMLGQPGTPGGYPGSREALLPSPMDGDRGNMYGRDGGRGGRGGAGRGGRGGVGRGVGRGRGLLRGAVRGNGFRSGDRGGRARRGGGGFGGGRDDGAYGGAHDGSFGGGREGGFSGGREGGFGGGREGGAYGGGREGGGGGPIRVRNANANYDRMQDFKPDTNVGYGSGNYEQRSGSGYGGDRSGGGGGGGGGEGGGGGGFRRSDPLSSNVSDSDPYYSSFSDSPARGYSRDYNHGSGSGDAAGGSEWRASGGSRRDNRHHPYQQQQPSGGYSY